MSGIPQRIVCLSAEAADWLWRIGAWEQVVGATAFFSQSPDVQRKPRVSGFNSANLEQITKLQPDLVITFSDVQAKLSGELVRRGLPVLATNQRALAEIESTLAMMARIVGREEQGEVCLREFRERLAPVEVSEYKLKVYFEEWSEPLISGIAWVSELIERAGGQDIFPELRERRSAPERVVTPEQVRLANPDLIVASWCGRTVETDVIAKRPGWSEINAVRNGRIYEILSEDILQPGFRLVYGFERLKQVIGAEVRV